MSEVFILSAVRTPIGVGKASGGLHPLSPVKLSSLVMQEAVRRAGVEPKQVEDVIWGCVTPVGDQGANLARLSLLQAGFPAHVPGISLNRMCGSSQQSVHFAAQAILSGEMDIVLAGGTEMMSHQALGSDYPPEWPQDFPYKLVHQGTTAELMGEARLEVPRVGHSRTVRGALHDTGRAWDERRHPRGRARRRVDPP